MKIKLKWDLMEVQNDKNNTLNGLLEEIIFWSKRMQYVPKQCHGRSPWGIAHVLTLTQACIYDIIQL